MGIFTWIGIAWISLFLGGLIGRVIWFFVELACPMPADLRRQNEAARAQLAAAGKVVL